MVNIFSQTGIPARDSCDNYVVKIPVEVALLLSAIHWRTGYNGPIAFGNPLQFNTQSHVLSAIGPYSNSNVIKSTSETYKWLVKTTGNYKYAIIYGLELIEEFKKRYDKYHKTESVLLWLKDHVPNIPDGVVTTDVGLAMPEKYKDRNNPTANYKNYILSEKSAVVSWKRSKVPDSEAIGCCTADWYSEKFVYTAGTDNRSYAVWFGKNDRRNFSDMVHESSFNQTTLLAIEKALNIICSEQYTIVTDSQYSINCLTKWVHVWTQNGWITSGKKPVKHKQLIQKVVDLLGTNKLLHVSPHIPQPDKNSVQWKHWNGSRRAYILASTAIWRWYPHPDNSNYAYTTDVKLDTGYPLKHVRSGKIMVTVDDESVNKLTKKDVILAKKQFLNDESVNELNYHLDV